MDKLVKKIGRANAHSGCERTSARHESPRWVLWRVSQESAVFRETRRSRHDRARTNDRKEASHCNRGHQLQQFACPRYLQVMDHSPEDSSENLPWHRGLELMSTSDTGLLVIDMQQKLLPLIAGHERITWNCRRLIDGAKLLGVAVAGTEQYPQGLGPTTAVLAERIGPMPAKKLFSARECESIFADWRDRGIFKVLVCGIEAHVCVQQTVLDLLSEGFRAYLAVDAIGSRFPLDAEIAVQRMNASGATLTTTEAALFEWCETAANPRFKAISGLIKESAPNPS